MIENYCLRVLLNLGKMILKRGGGDKTYISPVRYLDILLPDRREDRNVWRWRGIPCLVSTLRGK